MILQWNDGFGEIAPLPGFSRETLEEAQEEIVSLLGCLETAEPKLPSVRFGLACARIPFSLEAVRIPLCALGPKEGFSTIKLKVGHLGVDEAAQRVKGLIGKHKLRLDCNRAWPLEEALRFAGRFSPEDFEYLEEPVQTLDELIRFSELTGFPIAVDESLRELDAPWECIPSLKAAVVKPTLLGGIPDAPPGLPIVFSSSYETGVGLLHIARMAARISPGLPAGLDTVGALGEDILMSRILCEEGIFSWKNELEFGLNFDRVSQYVGSKSFAIYGSWLEHVASADRKQFWPNRL